MKAFIKKHQYNYIRKWLSDLNNALVSCADIKVIAASRAYTQEKIWNLFTDLSAEEKELLDIAGITCPPHVDKYLAALEEHTYGMPAVSNTQISKLFKKEKKLKQPSQSILDSKKVYLGWVDRATNKLFIAYNLEEGLVGMTCRITEPASNNKHRCMLCGRVGSEEDIAFVASLCKTPNAGEGTYRSVGFDVCLDSEKCNERITSVEKLEQILKDVNNMR